MTDELPYAGPERRVEPSGGNGGTYHDPEDLVEKTLERAAQKVATASVPATTPILSRTEAIVAIAILSIMNIAIFFVVNENRQDTRAHRTDFKAACQVIVAAAPPENVQEFTRRLAECLD